MCLVIVALIRAMRGLTVDILVQEFIEIVASDFSQSVNRSTVSWHASPLNDQTLNWSTTVERQWLGPKKPPAMLLLTNFGWNQPNQTAGLEIYRCLRTRYLVNGVINHPWFHPTAWEDINSGAVELSPTTRYYVFLDRETCAERNYPFYANGRSGNRDSVAGRAECCGFHQHFIHEIMNSTVMSSPNAKLILFECGGHGPKPHFQQDRSFYNGSRLVFASLSAHTEYDRRPQDLGLPPPAQHPCELSDQQRRDIESCAAEVNRTKLLTYTGQLRTRVRQKLARLHNHNDVLVQLKPTNETEAKHLLRTLAVDSIFSATPRGDNLFSYRFTEAMSCGSIPVVHADNWVYPFSPLLLNWSSIAIILPESNASETVNILRSISLEERCRRRRKVVEIYARYMKTGEGTINGLIESLELLAPEHFY
jgi:Exostosin family